MASNMLLCSLMPAFVGLTAAWPLTLPPRLCRSLSSNELDMHIDFRPFMQRTPFLTHSNASVSRAYRLFRTMGLHHLFVGPSKPMVTGMLTRKVCRGS